MKNYDQHLSVINCAMDNALMQFRRINGASAMLSVLSDSMEFDDDIPPKYTDTVHGINIYLIDTLEQINQLIDKLQIAKNLARHSNNEGGAA